MKKQVIAICLGLSGYGFCVDEYLPVARGAWELDAGYSLANGSGVYDAEGTKRDVSGDPMTHAIPLQIKYGIGSGMDLELFLPVRFNNADAGDKSGLDRPELALKYAHPDWAFAVFLNAVLPVAIGGFADDPAPGSAIGVGTVYDNTFNGNFRVNGLASYHYAVPSGDAKNQDVLTVLAKPEMVWSARVGTELGARFDAFGESVNGRGENNGDAGNLLTVFPGINVTQDPYVSYEVNVPLTLSGKRQAASWGLWASVYYTLPL